MKKEKYSATPAPLCTAGASRRIPWGRRFAFDNDELSSFAQKKRQKTHNKFFAIFHL
jgi:hypothetical protein